MSKSIDNQSGPRPTVWGAMALSALWTGGRMEYVAKTTLNEKFNVFADDVVEDTAGKPVEYWGVGRGTTYLFTDSQGVPDTANYEHEPVDASLYFFCPMAMRPKGQDDFTPEERAKLGMRTEMEINGTTWIAYMTRVIDRSVTTVLAEMVIPATKPGERDDRRPLLPDDRYLNPVPIEPDTTPSRTDGAYTDVTSIIKTVLTPAEIAELINAKQIISGNNHLQFTEIGLFGAVKEEKTVTDGGNSFTYTEGMKMQMHIVSPVGVIINDAITTGWSANHDLGMANPTNFKMWT